MVDEQLRAAFDNSASTYQTARPAYPTTLFDDLLAVTRITPPSRLLEIGAGPGTATLELAARGFAITALELGPDLATQARRNLEQFPAVEVITTSFEDWDPPNAPAYDLAYAANAWHWLDREGRWSKVAGLLSDHGHLAIFGASHAFPDGFDPFFTDIQAVYNDIGAGISDWPPPKPRLTNGDLVDEAVASGHFRRVDQRMYVWPQQYDADSYIALLNTFSNHIVLDRDEQDRLYSEVRRLLALRPDGRLTRHWIAQLAVLQGTAGE